MKVLVIGLAVSGRAAAHLLRSQGHDVVGFDSRPVSSEGLDGVRLHGGEWDRRLLSGVELVVPSPGVPETGPIMRDVIAEGLPVWSEMELGFRARAGVPVLAITGTNGKTTVTEMATAMLQASGLAAAAVGNIGDPISAAPDRIDVLVVEASSFQLRFIESFAPTAAVIVNFAPDHLDWHPDVAAYAAAKARIFEHAEADTPLVYDAEDPGAVALVADAPSQLIGVSGVRRVGASGRVRAELVLADAVIGLEELERTDQVMLTDLAAAAEGAAALGATGEGIAAAARAFRAGRHRREIVATVGGVTFIDDSKATNPHAALAAIGAYPSVVLIAGGRAKGLDIRPLARAETVRQVVAIGESASDLVEARPGVVVASDMRDAVASAIALSHPGDVVLLAPGCASFDMFESYGHRGDVFAAAVKQEVGV